LRNPSLALSRGAATMGFPTAQLITDKDSLSPIGRRGLAVLLAVVFALALPIAIED